MLQKLSSAVITKISRRNFLVKRVAQLINPTDRGGSELTLSIIDTVNGYVVFSCFCLLESLPDTKT